VASVAGSKGTVTLVHLYPREMSIYGDLGNTRCLATRLRRHGYTPNVVGTIPATELPAQRTSSSEAVARTPARPRWRPTSTGTEHSWSRAAADGTPMLMICGMYQLFGNAFITVDGARLPGLGILDVTTQGNPTRMIGPVVLDTAYGPVVGYENHSGATTLGPGQEPFGRVLAGHGNNGGDGTEGARTGNVIGSYLHGPILPANPTLADALIGYAVERATGRAFEPEAIDDHLADQARERQIARLLSGRERRDRASGQARGA
jgi:CobQ-like glutamine amidotransferase family enzyme